MVQSYDFGYEIVAVIISFIILFDFKRKYKFVRKSTKVFEAFMIIGAAESFMDIISSLLIMNTTRFHIAWNWLR